MDIVTLASTLPERAAVTAGRIYRAGAGLLQVAEELPALLLRVGTLLSAAEVLILRAGEIVVLAEEVAGRVDVVRAEAGLVAGGADTVVRRSAALVDSIEPLVAVLARIDPALLESSVAALDRLQPLLRAAATLEADLPAEVAELVQRALPLVRELSVTMIPLLHEAKAALPEIRDILAVVTRLEPVLTDVETRIAGLPGAGFLLKRGEREIAEAAAAEEKD